ncbi:MAG: hypothetical protein ACTSRU_15805 [Candidatus Hodarchaeales archaeon]
MTKLPAMFSQPLLRTIVLDENSIVAADRQIKMLEKVKATHAWCVSVSVRKRIISPFLIYYLY